MLEIRWHGRGGQGAKTASEMFAKIVFDSGKFVQSFPEFGPERAGAPMRAYNRIADTKIRMNHNIYSPDIVVILDPSLDILECLSGIKENGIVLINVSKENFNKLNLEEKIHNIDPNIKIYIIDGDKISQDELGRIYPNIPIMSALINISQLITKEKYFELGEMVIKDAFSQKENVIEGNINALIRAFNEVKKVNND